MFFFWHSKLKNSIFKISISFSATFFKHAFLKNCSPVNMIVRSSICLSVKISWPGFISSGIGASLDGRESSRFPTLACGGNEDFSALSGPYPEQHRRKLHYQAKKTMQRSRRVQRTLLLDKKRLLAKMGTRAWIWAWWEFRDNFGHMDEKVFEKKGSIVRRRRAILRT